LILLDVPPLGGYNYIIPRRAGLSATAGLSCTNFPENQLTSVCRPGCICSRSGWTASSVENRFLDAVHPYFKHQSCSHVSLLLSLLRVVYYYVVFLIKIHLQHCSVWVFKDTKWYAVQMVEVISDHLTK